MLYVASPNDQFHDVGELVDESVNVTASGAVPVVGVPVNEATGVDVAVTEIYSLFRVLLYPPVLNACNAT